MRKTFRFLSGCAIAALMLGGLASCEDKDIDAPDSPGVADRDITQYMAVTISAPKDSPFSRATGAYEHGAPAESKISTLDFYFFDNNGNAVSNPYHYDVASSNFPNEDNVTRFVPIVIEVNVAQGANLPTQTICFANLPASVTINGTSTTTTTLLTKKSISEIRELDIDALVNAKGNFVMSNSVYFGKNNITGEEKVRMCATPITGKYFATNEEAKTALGLTEGKQPTKEQEAKVVEIYIERLAAKVGLTLTRTAIEAYTLVNGDAAPDATNKTIDITFVPEYWFMNATSKTEHITKRYAVANDDGSILDTSDFNTIDGKLSKGGLKDAWNNETLFRSFWACSPSYYENSYPVTSDHVTTTSNYPVRYWEYSELVDEAKSTDVDKQVIAATTDTSKPWFSYSAGTTTGAGDDAGTTASGCIYTWETTTAISNINGNVNLNPAASIASAVIIGYYTVGTATAKPTTSFWIDSSEGTVNVTEGSNTTPTPVLHGTLYQTESNAIARLLKRQKVIYTKVTKTEGEGEAATTTTTYELATADNAGDFNLAHPDADVRAAMGNNPNIAGNLVSLIKKETTATDYYYYDGANYQKIDTDDEINKVNALLVEAGYLHQYYNGLARFSVPIRHLGWPANDTNLYNNGVYYWKNMRVGDLGVVRNHVYNLTISKIGGLGTGISDPDQPIVPPVETLKQYVASKINVLSWRIGNEWSVPL